MRVRDVMQKSPKSCDAAMNLATAAELFVRCGCGALPVVDTGNKVVGIITDRDLCLAVGTKDRRPSEINVSEAMSRPVATCYVNDEIHDALAVMRAAKVRRLPVVNPSGYLEGMLCLSDLIVDSRHDDGSHPELSYENVMSVLKAVHWRHSVCCPERAAAR